MNASSSCSDESRDAGEHLTGLFGDGSIVSPSSRYSSESHFALERRVLFRERPVYMGLSCEIATAGAYLTAMIDGVPIAVVRQADGSVRAMVNACRHRGAPVLSGRGEDVHRLQCPYHAWTYDLDDVLLSRPRSDGAFDDVTIDCDLHAVSVGHGLLFVCLDGRSVDVDAALEGAVNDLASFCLAGYTHVESRRATWKKNWKLVLDAFTESYHIRTLHRESLAPDVPLRSVHLRGVRHEPALGGIAQERVRRAREAGGGAFDHPLRNDPVTSSCRRASWYISSTTSRRGASRRSTSARPRSRDSPDERALRYWIKNLDLLLRVTGTEDFPLMEKIQRSLDSGAIPNVVYGGNEPALVYLHRAIDAALVVSGGPAQSDA